jgi:hypothetical protein
MCQAAMPQGENKSAERKESNEANAGDVGTSIFSLFLPLLIAFKPLW